MKLHSPAFEKALKAGMHQAIRCDPELKAEYRRSGRPQRNWAPMGMIFLSMCWGAALAVMVARVYRDSHDFSAALMVLTAWAALCVFFWDFKLFASSVQRERGFFHHFPISLESLARWDWDRMLVGSFSLFIVLLIGLGTLSFLLQSSWIAWVLAVVVSGLTWWFTVSLAIVASAWTPGKPMVWGSLAFILCCLTAVPAWNWLPLRDRLIEMAPAFGLVMPTGWPLALFELARPAPHLAVLGFLVPVGVICAAMPAAWRTTRARYGYAERERLSPPDDIPGNKTVLPERPLGETAIAEGIFTGDFLSHQPWTGDFLERALWRWLDEEEKICAAYAFPHGCPVVKWWRNIAIQIVIVAALAWLASFFSEVWPLVVGLLGFFGILALVLGLALGTGEAFSGGFSGGMRHPYIAVFPIDLRVLLRFLVKASVVRLTPAAAAYVAFFVGLKIYEHQVPLAKALFVGFQLALILLGLRLVMFGANAVFMLRERGWFPWRKMLVFLLVIGNVVLLVGGGIVWNFLLGVPLGTLAMALTLGMTYGVLNLCLYLHLACRFDAISRPR